MAERCCVFVDGENLRHSIVDLFPTEFRREDHLPKEARWGEFFDWLVGQAAPGCHRLRTYWYVVQHIDFFPYRFPKPERAVTPEEKAKRVETLKRLLCRHDPYKLRLAQLTGDMLVRAMEECVRELRNTKSRMQRRFEGWTAIQNGIVQRHNAVEFRRAGSIRCNLFDFSLGTEKAVDVKLATDMILLRDIYEVAVVVSGDQDYVPAVQAVKDFGKKVINVGFETRSGKLLPGGAWRLNLVTDKSERIPYDVLGRYLNLMPDATASS